MSEQTISKAAAVAAKWWADQLRTGFEPNNGSADEEGTVANTLAWDRNLPIIEVSASDLSSALKDLRNLSAHEYVKIAAVQAAPLTQAEKSC